MNVAQHARHISPSAPSPSHEPERSSQEMPDPLPVTPYQLPTPSPSEDTFEFAVQSRDDVQEPANNASRNIPISMSTTFHPTSDILSTRPDTILLSSDGVVFYVHHAVMLANSSNDWNHSLSSAASRSGSNASSSPKVVPCPEPAPVLNIVLHVAYGISDLCESYKPNIDVLSAAVDAMATYGLSPAEHLAPSTPLYALILAQAPTKPIAAFALAASHDLYDLAAPISTHLLSFPLHSLTDALSLKIGSLYLKKLIFLQLSRSEALRELLRTPPHPHPPADDCVLTDQRGLARAWMLAAAYLVWDRRPDIRTSASSTVRAPPLSLRPPSSRRPSAICLPSLCSMLHGSAVRGYVRTPAALDAVLRVLLSRSSWVWRRLACPRDSIIRSLAPGDVHLLRTNQSLSGIRPTQRRVGVPTSSTHPMKGKIPHRQLRLKPSPAK
ncbi:hypothetical protein OH76DRAFT_934528 [Lentinus brumalis]|uniref:BTB domain-containing protein n=1 Tax=Lentinus brumalis TaxID=2498619 RepID=A0A371CZA4_9APHY|nr:hypothetical protein OH76DRAFT_934528 [Polyporus brumalis]